GGGRQYGCDRIRQLQLPLERTPRGIRSPVSLREEYPRAQDLRDWLGERQVSHGEQDGRGARAEPPRRNSPDDQYHGERWPNLCQKSRPNPEPVVSPPGTCADQGRQPCWRPSIFAQKPVLTPF